MRRLSSVILFVCLIVLISTTASAVQLNAAFGSGGMALVPLEGQNPSGLHMARQSTGAIVLSYVSEDDSNNSITRIHRLSDLGAPLALTLENVQITGYSFRASDIAIDASNNIFLVGIATNDSTFDAAYAIVKLTSDGAFDASFGGGDGIVIHEEDTNSKQVFSIMIDGTSLYVAATHDFDTGRVMKFVLDGITPGAFDIGWGGGTGIVSLAGLEVVGALAKSVTNIVAAGFDFDTANARVTRFNADGTPDLTFGVGGSFGFSYSNYTSNDGLMSIVPDASGNLYVIAPTFNDVELAKVTTLGALDITFGGGDGIATSDFLTGIDRAAGLAVDATGKPIVVATVDFSLVSLDREFGLLRYTTTGVLDSAFGVGGKFGVDVFGFSDNAQDMILAGSDLFVAGFVSSTDFEGIGSEELLGVVKLDTAAGSTGGKNFIVQNLNTGFEQSGSGPAKTFAWKGTNLTGDVRKCDKPNKNKFYAFTGNCAFVFAGGAGENSTIKQTLSNFGATIIDAGDALDYSMMVQAATKLKLKVKIKLVFTAGGSETLYNNSFTSPDPAYTQYVGGGDTATHEVKKVVISINNKASGSKTNVDNFTFQKIEFFFGGPRGAAPLPAPAAPASFRGAGG